MVKSAFDEMNALLYRSAGMFGKHLNEVARAYINRDSEALDEAVTDFTDTLSATMGLSDLMGRRRLILELDAARGDKKGLREILAFMGARAADVATPILPKVAFEEAISDIVDREPRLAASAREVAELYSREHVFTFARSSSVKVVNRVQSYINEAMREGHPGTFEAGEVIRELTGTNQAHAETIYSTNVASSYAAGRFRMAQDEEVREVAPALMVVTARDSDVRDGSESDENHRDFDGLVAPARHPIWSRAAPPYGYRCRCGVRLATKFELRRKGTLDEIMNNEAHEPPNFSRARAHPNFALGRPDLVIYGTTLE